MADTPQEVRDLLKQGKINDTGASSAVDSGPASGTTATVSLPPASPPLSPPAESRRKSPAPEMTTWEPPNKPRFDRLGNRLPDRPRQGSAMASVYGKGKIRLPGDLGSKDPRRPRSPLPGDLGAKDPRRPSSTSASPAPGGHARKASDPMEGADGGVRLQEDPPEAGDGVEEDSVDEEGDYDTDASNSVRGRGRKRPEPGKTTAGKAVNLQDDSDSDAELRRKIDPTKGESYRSLLGDPTIKVTPPSDLPMHRKKGVHPSTAFDATPSRPETPIHSDDDDHRNELRMAQKLSLNMSAVHSTPSAHRVIRQIIRGDYAHFQHEAEEGRKRQRMYLVATDLSPEAEYALEWTIGTVLRDGDTLFAVYAVDEEGAGEAGVEIGHGAESVQDTAAIVRSLPVTNAVPQTSGPSPLAKSSMQSDGRSASRGVYSSAELERRRALEEVSDRCVRLLRKTRLQVRVVVEVFHCKSPRHMITEVIDFLSPTLVIIGSRGRSAVKGVLLGSFSNYLVTKSSVPVMVARKKLRKHSKQMKRVNKDGTPVPYAGPNEGRMRPGRLSNVIEVPTGRGLRGKDWREVKID